VPGLYLKESFKNTTTSFKLRALLTESGAEQLELARAQRTPRAGLENDMDALASMHNCINTEVRFRALLTEGGNPRVQLHRAGVSSMVNSASFAM
jgi:hypothetical protein